MKYFSEPKITEVLQFNYKFLQMFYLRQITDIDCFKKLLFFFACCCFISTSSCNSDSQSETSIYIRSQNQLLQLLHYEKEWVKVHAAECLITLDHQKSTTFAVFQKELQKYGHNRPYRIGIWRVLAQLDSTPDKWIDSIRLVAQDTSAIDQLHAIESLAKLQINNNWLDSNLKKHIFSNGSNRLKSYTNWAMVFNDQSNKIDSLTNMLKADDPEVKRIGALAIRKVGFYPKSNWKQLAQSALDETKDSKAKVFLIAAALVTCLDQDNEIFKTLKSQLLQFQFANNKGQRYVVCETLAIIGNQFDISNLEKLMNLEQPILAEGINIETSHLWDKDISGLAAFAILKILKKGAIRH